MPHGYLVAIVRPLIEVIIFCCLHAFTKRLGYDNIFALLRFGAGVFRVLHEVLPRTEQVVQPDGTGA